MRSPARRPTIRLVAALLAVGAMGAGGIAVAGRPSLTPPQRALQAEVDDPTGAPRTGHDPAVQRQIGLAAAAAAPVGSGSWGSKPARAVGGGHAVHAPGSVLGDPRTTGTLASGCVVGYGSPGAQCLPAHAPGGGAIGCAVVVRLFPTGIPVTGPDRLHLDTNGDGVACGAGDTGARGR